jgi:hypothetical protein
MSDIDLANQDARRALNSQVNKLQTQLIALAQQELDNSEKPTVANGFF